MPYSPTPWRSGNSGRPSQAVPAKPDRAELEARAGRLLGYADLQQASEADLASFVCRSQQSVEERRHALLELERVRESRIGPAAWRSAVPGGTWQRVQADYCGPGRQDGCTDPLDKWEGPAGLEGPPYIPVVPYAQIVELRAYSEPGVSQQVISGAAAGVQQLYNMLTNPPCYILDCSPQDQFEACHVRSAVSMAPALEPIHEFLDAEEEFGWAEVVQAMGDSARLLPKPASVLEARGQADKGHAAESQVLVYGSDEGVCRLVAALVMSELKPWKCFLLSGGIDRVRAEKPLLCLSGPTHEDRKLPTEVVEGFLYLGGEPEAKDLSTLRALGCSAVCNATDNLPHFHIDSELKYYRVSVGDFANWSEQIADRLEGAADWIEAERAAGGRVLVHCMMGMSRSTTIVLAWMIKHGGWTLDAAFKHVKAIRKRANPNCGFLNELARWEIHVRGESSVAFPRDPTLGMLKSGQYSLRKAMGQVGLTY